MLRRRRIKERRLQPAGPGGADGMDRRKPPWEGEKDFPDDRRGHGKTFTNGRAKGKGKHEHQEAAVAVDVKAKAGTGECC